MVEVPSHVIFFCKRNDTFACFSFCHRINMASGRANYSFEKERGGSPGMVEKHFKLFHAGALVYVKRHPHAFQLYLGFSSLSNVEVYNLQSNSILI